MTLNEYQSKPVLTSDGKPWVQRCYVCDKPINLLKTAPHMVVKVGELRRHKKCWPGMPVDVRQGVR